MRYPQQMHYPPQQYAQGGYPPPGVAASMPPAKRFREGAGSNGFFDQAPPGGRVPRPPRNPFSLAAPAAPPRPPVPVLSSQRAEQCPLCTPQAPTRTTALWGTAASAVRRAAARQGAPHRRVGCGPTRRRVTPVRSHLSRIARALGRLRHRRRAAVEGTRPAAGRDEAAPTPHTGRRKWRRSGRRRTGRPGRRTAACSTGVAGRRVVGARCARGRGGPLHDDCASAGLGTVSRRMHVGPSVVRCGVRPGGRRGAAAVRATQRLR